MYFILTFDWQRNLIIYCKLLVSCNSGEDLYLSKMINMAVAFDETLLKIWIFGMLSCCLSITDEFLSLHCVCLYTLSFCSLSLWSFTWFKCILHSCILTLLNNYLHIIKRVRRKQLPTYLVWGLLLINWNETLLINTYIFRWGWRWWQDINKHNNNINTCIICI